MDRNIFRHRHENDLCYFFRWIFSIRHNEILAVVFWSVVFASLLFFGIKV